eukprot:scaffold145112_cov30-Tisochrysis_lutea.AAC.6
MLRSGSRDAMSRRECVRAQEVRDEHPKYLCEQTQLSFGCRSERRGRHVARARWGGLSVSSARNHAVRVGCRNGQLRHYTQEAIAVLVTSEPARRLQLIHEPALVGALLRAQTQPFGPQWGKLLTSAGEGRVMRLGWRAARIAVRRRCASAKAGRHSGGRARWWWLRQTAALGTTAGERGAQVVKEAQQPLGWRRLLGDCSKRAKQLLGFGGSNEGLIKHRAPDQPRAEGNGVGRAVGRKVLGEARRKVCHGHHLRQEKREHDLLM